MAERIKDHYKALGIPSFSSDDDIKQAYRKLAQRYHPDSSKEANSAEKFRAVTEAYQVLSNPLLKTDYDARLRKHRAEGKGRHKSLQDISIKELREKSGKHLKDVLDVNQSVKESVDLGSIQDRLKKNQTTDGKSKEFNLQITSTEAVYGCKHEIDIGDSNSPQVVALNVPALCKNNTKLRIKAKGKGTEDVFVKIEIIQDENICVKGNDIELRLPISINTALNGREISLPIGKDTIKIKIPENSLEQKSLKYPGYGILDLKTKARGNLFVTTYLLMPDEIPSSAEETFKATDHFYSGNIREELLKSF